MELFAYFSIKKHVSKYKTTPTSLKLEIFILIKMSYLRPYICKIISIESSINQKFENFILEKLNYSANLTTYRNIYTYKALVDNL